MYSAARVLTPQTDKVHCGLQTSLKAGALARRAAQATSHLYRPGGFSDTAGFFLQHLPLGDVIPRPQMDQ